MKKTFRARLYNVTKWCACIAHVPLFYATLPFQICIKSPLASYAMDDQKSPNNVEEDDETKGSLAVFAHNLSAAMIGTVASATLGCCCFGCGGSFCPNDF